jgi:hypothetical protein
LYIEQIRHELQNMTEMLRGTKPGGMAGDVAWLQALCEHVNALPEDEAAEWRDTNAEQLVRVLWYTPDVLSRLGRDRRRRA